MKTQERNGTYLGPFFSPIVFTMNLSRVSITASQKFCSFPGTSVSRFFRIQAVVNRIAMQTQE